MTRIPNDFMADLEAKLADIENDYTPTCRDSKYGNGCGGATADSIAFWRAAVDCVPAMLAEIRDRRAADLSDEARDELAFLRRLFQPTIDTDIWPASKLIRDRVLSALSVLDKVIARKVPTRG